MILQLAPDYYNSSIYRSLFRALANRGFVNHVYVADNISTSAQHENTDTSTIHIAGKTFSPLDRLLYFPKQKFIFDEITHTIPIKDVDIVHAHTLFSSGYSAYRLWKQYGIPYIVAVRNTDVNVFLHYMKHLAPIGWATLANASRVVFLSPVYKQIVLSKYIPRHLRSVIEEKSVVIPNGINPLFLSETPARSYDENCIRMIYIGKIMRLKNIDMILRVCDILSSEGKNIHLTLVGQIVEKRYSDIANSRSYITYSPPITPERVRELLRENDIMLMPSFAETFGLVYAEAMSQGLPVIYTRGQGFDGWFADGEVGYAVSPRNAKEIKQRIADIYMNYPTISERCQQACKQFDWEQIADTYTDIYKSIIK